MTKPSTDAHLAACIKVSRRLGADPSLVLHGGGNTSAKSTRTDITGSELNVLYVKGSGHNLAEIGPEGFTPLRLERVLALAKLSALDDLSYVNELRQASFDADAPVASIEAVLHGVLPHRFVLHTHADAIVTLTNQVDGERLISEILGDGVLVLPYVKPGFDLAVQVVDALRDYDPRHLNGIVLLNHGLFTFSDDAEDALGMHLDLVARARETLPDLPSSPSKTKASNPLDYAKLRAQWSQTAGFPMILHQRASAIADALIARDDVTELATRGPLTPEHVIHTKRVPLVGRDFADYADNYRSYVEAHRPGVEGNIVAIDAAPRVLLDTELGLVTAGTTPKAATIAADIAEHTAAAVLQAEAMSGYRTLSPAESFEIEYWTLEQRKLATKRTNGPFVGEVALVTGAASGIGRACGSALQEAGAVVIAVDRDPAVLEANGPTWMGVIADVTDAAALTSAVHAGVLRFGGLDILVPAAGVFAASHPLAGFPESAWKTSMDVNVTGLLTLLGVAHPFLALAQRGGRVVLIGSKNMPAPGPGAAAYSASKAAASQLARVAALEWAKDGINVNIVNPDAVFDTALWSAELLDERAAKYGMTVTEYKQRNLLGTEITSADVGRLVVAMCSDIFHATTGAQIPIDGGSDRII